MNNQLFQSAMVTVRVYKTDVGNRSAAKTIVDAVRRHLPDCNVSLDLEDCDNVLRVESLKGRVNESKVFNILHNYGYQIERLP